MMEKKKSKGKIILLILLCILILLIAGWGILSVSIYNDNFNKRFQSYEPLLFYTEDFEGLECTEYQFESDHGQMLAGYFYTACDNPHCIIVLAHGFGAGHNSYMDAINFFAQNGYCVFAYDATGNDKSEGDGVGGVPQGAIDLDHAISFAEENLPVSGLPVALFGHSWGGYSAGSVLTYHPEVKAVIECCGCNRSSDLFEAGGLKQAGSLIYTMMPFVRLYERIRFGKYAANTALDGFAATDAAVMVVHSEDDSVVPIRYGYDLYYAKYRNDPRFQFLRFTDKGHNSIFNDQTYMNAFNAEFDQWKETLGYDISADENRERFQQDRAAYISEHLDRSEYCDMLDKELFEQFLGFYDAHTQ